MIRLVRTNSENSDFVELVRHLDAELAIRDGSDHAFYSQFNKINQIKFVVLAYEGDKPVGCGAIREYDPLTMEVKRMYVSPEVRGKGIAGIIITELEAWACELQANRCILETGKNQPEAIRLYYKIGYTSIENYGQYAGVYSSFCFEKKLAD